MHTRRKNDSELPRDPSQLRCAEDSASGKGQQRMEARVRIELTHKGFADLSLTAWVPRLIVSARRNKTPHAGEGSLGRGLRFRKAKLERETGFEPATSTLARSHSTTELLPLGDCIINIAENEGKPGLAGVKPNSLPDPAS